MTEEEKQMDTTDTPTEATDTPTEATDTPTEATDTPTEAKAEDEVKDAPAEELELKKTKDEGTPAETEDETTGEDSEKKDDQTEADDDAERRVIVRAVGVKKHYEMKGVVTKALRNIDMEIYAGEFICVMGPSGSGKSTFFNMVGGLDSPTAGRVFIDEVDVAQLSAVELAFLRCRKIGYIFQSYNLIQYQTALENVTTPMAFGGVPPDEARNRGMDILDLVGLKSRWFHRPIEMSGGQQQRVAIGRSLANNPMILLADEPTANLDLKTGQEVLEILQRINKEKGVTVICATHDYRMMNICDRLMWIRDGEIERIANRKDVDIQLSSIEGE